MCRWSYYIGIRYISYEYNILYRYEVYTICDTTVVEDRVKGFYAVRRPYNNTCRRQGRCVQRVVSRASLHCCGAMCVRVVKTIYDRPSVCPWRVLGPRKSLRPRKKGGVIKRLIKIGGHLPARVYAAHKLSVYYRHRLIYDRSRGARTQRRTPFVI